MRAHERVLVHIHTHVNMHICLQARTQPHACTHIGVRTTMFVRNFRHMGVRTCVCALPCMCVEARAYVLVRIHTPVNMCMS